MYTSFLLSVSLLLLHHVGAVLYGVPAIAISFPSIVSIFSTLSPKNHLCAGIMVTPLHVLTSSLCVAVMPVGTILVRYGTANRFLGWTVPVVRKDTSPKINSTSIQAELTLLTLGFATSSKYQAQIGAADYEIADYSSLRIAGWGLTGYNGVQPSVLYYQNITVYPPGNCVDAFGSNFSADANVCVGEVWACFGDVGGPVIDFSGRVVGIITHQYDCKNAISPDFFARLGYYASWLEGLVTPDGAALNS